MHHRSDLNVRNSLSAADGRPAMTETLFIDGAFAAAASGKGYPVLCPATEEQIATIADAGAEDVDRAVEAARRAFDCGDWSRLSGAARGRLLHRLAELIERDADALVAMECRNTGMPEAFARAASINRAPAFLRYNAGWADKLVGETIPVEAPDQWAMTVREPIGVVGAIISWNVPLINAVGKLAPALAAGCTMVLKVSAQAPLTAIALAKLVAEAGFPAGAFNLITGDGTVAPRALVDHPLVDKIAFTGSTATGKAIVAAAAPSLKRVTLELGGKSPVIIFPDADLTKAATTAAAGIFSNAGQVCIAGSRLFVHRSVADQVVEHIVARAKSLRLGIGSDAEMGPLISATQRERVLGYFESARADGMTCLTGGEAVSGPGHYVQPTVLTGDVANARVLEEEIFGPVLCVTRFDDEDLTSIAAKVNATSYGLSANIWTRDISKALGLARLIQSGSVRINGGTGYDMAVPFGGYKQSGIGRENGGEGVKAYTELKAITVAL